MSKQDHETEFEHSTEPRNQPVVAIDSTPDQLPEAVIRTILRAQEHGHHAMLTYTGLTNNTTVTYANRLGATTINTDTNPTNGPATKPIIQREAREAGFPGVIWQDATTDAIDYAASVDALQESDEFLVEAIPEPAVDTNPEILVGIPAYNEADRIESVIAGATAHADTVLVVDDGSTDNTSQVARDAGATVVTHTDNQGYGAALQTIFSEAARSHADHLVILDGDGQHDPNDITRLITAQRDHDAELVIGNRFHDDADTTLPLYRRFGLAIVNLLTNVSLGAIRPQSRVTDTQSGFRAYNHDAITTLAAADDIGNHMGASTDILHHAYSHNYDIEEIGTTVNYDLNNTSNKDPVNHGLLLVSNLLRTIEQERPISSIGVPGFLSTVIGIGLAYWTLSNYISTGTFSLGLAVGSVFFALAGIFACFTAIILHALQTQVRADG